jgi:hypothetical protein
MKTDRHKNSTDRFPAIDDSHRQLFTSPIRAFLAVSSQRSSPRATNSATTNQIHPQAPNPSL